MKEQHVFIEYVPEHYVHNVSVTIKCKESEHKEYKKWFDYFVTMRELDMDTINLFLGNKELE